MSITTVEHDFGFTLENIIITDFIIDSDDLHVIYPSLNKYTIKNSKLKINIIQFDDKVNRVSSFTIIDNSVKYSDEELEKVELEKIEIDYCVVLILSEQSLTDKNLDNWLEKCIDLKELYQIEPNGNMYISSGFGPGIYKLIGLKINNELIGIKIEFIKENI
jgi:hypothetical protein